MVPSRGRAGARRGVTILVLGAGGQVGRALVERAGPGAIGLTRTRCDVRVMAEVERALAEVRPSLVVNCAAFTKVDAAETARADAFAVNAEGAANVARAAARSGLPVIHVSSDYVYDGTRGPHREDESPSPLNVYGESKAAGDAAVAAANAAHLILRTSWVFGVHGANFVKTMLDWARDRGTLRVVDDVTGAPTEARDIADAILPMAEASLRPGFASWGIYHFAGAPDTSWCGFAREIFARAQRRVPEIVPIRAAERAEPARRPMNSRLDCSKIAANFGIARPDWRPSLSRVLAALAQAAA
jgi:dTDP-4-dehydrorhamnose reductase